MEKTSTEVLGFACPSIFVDTTLVLLKISNGFIFINLSFKFISPLLVISKYSFTMKFIVNNYASSFGNGKSHYFNFDLYNSNGKQLLNASINKVYILLMKLLYLYCL